MLSQHEEDNFTIIPSIGNALYSVKDFSAYDNGKEAGDIKQINEIRPIYKLELEKDWYLDVYISVQLIAKTFIWNWDKGFCKIIGF